MERKKKPNGILISGLISALASLAIVAVAPGFAAKPDTQGNERKSGYEDNSSTPQATNHGKGADNDGDADSDSNTAYKDDHTTADSGDNAHPSGKDRSVEKGKSGNQGKAESNPDDSKGPMRYEGKQGDDKPGGPGGTDLADQDGNNGCGNDDDFNDDNNGWCGKPTRTKPSKSTQPSDGNEVKGGNDSQCPDKDDMVQGKSCSEPDNDGRGPDRNESGRDKDEDGNNGCGNDADRTDDNEGWCGKPDRDEDEVEGIILCPDGSEMPEGGNCGEGVPCPDGTVMDADGNCQVMPELDENPANPGDDVLGDQISRDEQAAAPEGPSVLGIRLSPALNEPVKVAGAVLPFTGGDVLLFLLLALALFGSGLLIMKSTKAKSHTS